MTNPIPMPKSNRNRAAPAKPRVTTKMLDVGFTRGRQDVTLHQLMTFKFGLVEEKLELTIKSDAYRSQCLAFVNIYHPVDRKWNKLVSIHFGNMKTPEGLVYIPEMQALISKEAPNLDFMMPHFAADRSALLKLVEAILC